MQKKSTIRTKLIPQSTKEMSNCCSGLRLYLERCAFHRIRKLELNTPVVHENWLGPGSSKFLAHEQPERARSTDAAAHKRKTHVPPNGSANVSSRKRTCHRNAFQ